VEYIHQVGKLAERLILNGQENEEEKSGKGTNYQREDSFPNIILILGILGTKSIEYVN